VCISAGAFEATPHYSGAEDLVYDYESHVGEQTELSGVVVDTAPVRIEVEYFERTREFTVSGLETTLADGDHIALFGTVHPDHTIAAHNAIVRNPWEMQYMYAISLVGGVWILGRLLNGWKITREKLAFIPREDTLLSGGDSDG
jgi:hypothetical protein